jgi:hypothetical protein
VKLYETKQYKKAIKAADQILKKFPDHGETLAMKVRGATAATYASLLGVACYLELHQYSGYASCARQAPRNWPTPHHPVCCRCCLAGPDPELHGQEGGGI